MWPFASPPLIQAAKETLVKVHGKFDPSKFTFPSDFKPVSLRTMGSERWGEGTEQPWNKKPPHQAPPKTHGHQ